MRLRARRRTRGTMSRRSRRGTDRSPPRVMIRDRTRKAPRGWMERETTKTRLVAKTTGHRRRELAASSGNRASRFRINRRARPPRFASPRARSPRARRRRRRRTSSRIRRRRFCAAPATWRPACTSARSRARARRWMRSSSSSSKSSCLCSARTATGRTPAAARGAGESAAARRRARTRLAPPKENVTPNVGEGAKKAPRRSRRRLSAPPCSPRDRGRARERRGALRRARALRGATAGGDARSPFPNLSASVDLTDARASAEDADTARKLEAAVVEWTAKISDATRREEAGASPRRPAGRD